MASTTVNASTPAYLLSGVSVSQPPYLEGDPNLATEILPGPPSLVSIQQSMLKRDPKKPANSSSYLPHTDPGSTYSGIMHGTLIGHEQEATRLKPTKSAIGRAQRATARHQNGAASDNPLDSELASALSLNPIPVESEPDAMITGVEPSISRSSSSQNLRDGIAGIVGRPKRKDNGKGKEPAVVRVKEEPKPVSLHSPDPPSTLVGSAFKPMYNINNDDHCSSCRSYGSLVYCDGCPRAFHLWCLDPPMETVDEGDSRWFCPGCTIRKHPPRKPPPSLLAPLIQQVDNAIPTEFQLPEELRTFFKDVGTGPKGTYIDTSELKPPRLNRHGQLEERDPHRLRDRNGVPVLCFRCGTSALPGGVAATKRPRRSSTHSKANDAWKSMVSCDYCALHWHLDCLDPPLPSLPAFSKKWMCPNHAERIMPGKHRVPKNATTIEITKPRQSNNGNIEITHPLPARAINDQQKLTVDEVLINGRRYRVPERVVVLDFWNKLNKTEPRVDKDSNIASVVSSPLTSLSSLEDDDQIIPDVSRISHDPEDLKVAQMLCTLSLSRPRVPLLSQRSTVKSSIVLHREATTTPTSRTSRVIKLPHISTQKAPEVAKHLKPSEPAHTRPQRSSTSADYQPSSASKRKKLNHPSTPAAEPITRELRSRSRNNFDSSLTSISSRADDSGRDSIAMDVPASFPSSSRLPAPVTTSSKGRPLQVKLEETDHQLILSGASFAPTISTPVKRRGRAPKAIVTNVETREKRSRKRKEREDEVPSVSDKTGDGKGEKEIKEKKSRKISTRTPGRRRAASPVVGVEVSSNAPPATPSLKIRLPRLNSGVHVSPSIANNNGDTPTRL
ncbi:hypothetical protein H0H93_011545 [Arthromyces matolae]|nr:hypothetical protein H0H93_011545 [Arthromyces matolae]